MGIGNRSVSMKSLCNIVLLVLLGHQVRAFPPKEHLNSLPVENHLKIVPYSGVTPEDVGDVTSGPEVHGMFTLNPWLSLTLPKGPKQPRLGNPRPQHKLNLPRPL